MDHIKILGKHFVRLVLRIYYIFPIKRKRIIFNSMMWKQYSCNPKYVTEYLLNHYPGQYEIIWAFYHPEKFEYLKEKGIKICKVRTLKYYYYRLTAGISICNATMGSEVPPRSGQYRINTWHGGGGGYKKIDYSGSLTYWSRKEMSETDLFCASSETSLRNTVRNAFHHEGSFFSGTPRNDMLIKNDRADIVDGVYGFFGLSGDTKILLYAPTYREGLNVRHSSETFDYNLDYVRLKQDLEKHFGGKWAIAIRFHPKIKHYIIPEEEGVIDATMYPDMQELMVAVSAMITDYSSSLWDFSFTSKPCILFCSDLTEYKTKRGFNKPIEEWGFPIAENNDELSRIIQDWDQDEFLNKMKLQHKENGSFEDGNATKRMCELIYDRINGQHR